MLRLAPAERVTAIVEMNHPGAWVMGEVRKHIMAAGMGIVVEYAGSSANPGGINPKTCLGLSALCRRGPAPAEQPGRNEIPLGLRI